MKANCIITRKEFKKLLLKKRNETNVFYLTLFSILFLIVCFKLIIHNIVFMGLIYLVSLILMTLSLYFVNILYTTIQLNITENKAKNSYGKIIVTATDEYLSEDGETSSFKVMYKDVIYHRFTKKYFMITDKKTSLLLRKGFFENEDEYIKIRDYVKKMVKGK